MKLAESKFITTCYLKGPGPSPSSGVTFNSAVCGQLPHQWIYWWGNCPHTVYTYAHSFTHTQASCQLLTRQIGTVVYSMAPLHIPNGPSQFIWKWLDEGKQHVTVIGLQMSYESMCCVIYVLFFFGVYFPSVPYLFLGFFFQTFRPFNGPYFCSSFKGLFHRPNHQRQHQLLPHVQEDVPAPSRDDGRQSRCSSRPRRLGATVCWILLECFAAHVSNTEAHIIIHAQTYTLIRVLTQEL